MKKLFVILSITLLIFFYKIDKPFWGHHDWNGVYWGNVARNYARYGLSTKLAQVENVGFTIPEKFSYTFHYLPLYPIAEGLVFAIYGVNEWSARLLSVAFSLGTLIIFYKLVSAKWSKKIAIVSTVFWVFNPMLLYFGKMPVHEPMVLFFIILFWYSFILKKRLLTYISLILAEATTWTGFFVVPVATIYSWRRSIPLWIISVTVFLIFLLFDYLVTGSLLGGGLKEIFLTRVKMVPLLEYVTRLGSWSWAYFTFLIFMSAFWFLKLLIRRVSPLPLVFLGTAVIYPVIFRDASFRHDYLLIYFLPFLALTSAIVVNKSILVALFISLTIFMRLSFYQALLDSDIYKDSVLIGKAVKKDSGKAGIPLVTLSKDIQGFDGWFVSFYADRKYKIIKSAK